MSIGLRCITSLGSSSRAQRRRPGTKAKDVCVIESGRSVGGACVGLVPSNHCISVADLSLWSTLHVQV